MFPGETSAQTIDPLVGEVQLPEGDDLTLSCNYTTGSYTSATLFWYHQSPGSSPEHLLTVVSGSKAESHGRLKAEVDVNDKRVDLKISSAAVSDSVLYYCALRPTVTGNPDTLYRNLQRKFLAFLPHCVCFSALGGSAADGIQPLFLEQHVLEGADVSLSCNYSGSYIRGFQWYHQYPGSRPEFLLSLTESSKGSDPARRLTAEAKKHLSRVDLKISSAAVSDSVLYYCALQPTVTGNPDTLYRNWFYD
ncbi:hypothetical protein NFI96_031698 [Prochilodus magdalenae]|nr:hypothetical protein NFI96_031698 [Prochilodus magdalenae]